MQLAADDAQWRQRGHLFLVADGMGAHAVGEKASEQAAGVIPHTYLKHVQHGPARRRPPQGVHRGQRPHPRLRPGQPRIRGHGHHDHRPAAAARGRLGQPRRRQPRLPHPRRLDRTAQLRPQPACGSTPASSTSTPTTCRTSPATSSTAASARSRWCRSTWKGRTPIQAGDMYLLCSDGLSGQVTDSEMGAVASALPPAEACRFLVDLANLRGGPDNITALIVRVGRRPGEQRRPRPAAEKAAACRGRPGGSARSSSACCWSSSPFLLAFDGFPGGVFVFLLAAAAVVAGLVGLGLHYRQRAQAAQRGGSRKRRRRRASTAGPPAASSSRCWTACRGR